MNPKTKNKLGILSFSSTVSVKSSPGYGPNGSGTERRVIGTPGSVTFTPYSQPSWRTKIRLGADATTSLVGYELSSSKQRFYHARALFGWSGGKTRDAVASGMLFTHTGSIPTTAPSTLPKAETLASEKFFADYYAKTRSIRGASTIAEAASTIRMLASPAKALRNAVSDLHRSLTGKLRRAGGLGSRDAKNVIAGTWLEWQFGIKPLISDVDSAAQAINRLRDGDFRPSIPIRGSGSDQQVLTYRAGVAFNAGATIGLSTNIGRVDLITKRVSDVTIRGKILFPYSAEVPAPMQFGVGVEDILPAVWEAVPWSFFVDYFVNVSSVIDSFSVIASNISWANRTVRNSRVHTVSDAMPLPNDQFGNDYQRYTAGGGAGEVSFTSVTRHSVSPGSLVTPLRVKFPEFGTKWANIAALAAMRDRPRF